ncbi:MAG: metal-dependent hydrolase [Elusimicrobiota bacterium]|nr:metal-dependent hydrolase [Elusimicrobiota bacterium]
MFPFGHVGPSMTLARRWGADARWAAVLALGPDLVDKPLSMLVPVFVNGNTRSIGHTALAAAIVLAALVAARRRLCRPWFLWGCWLSHLALDRMWLDRSPEIFLWPLRGGFPPPDQGYLETYFNPWYVFGEAAGVLLLAAFVLRHGLTIRSRLADFLRSGRLS